MGSEGERALDISKLRAQTGYITLDEGYVNTGSTHQRDHVSRRREGRPALPRLSGRSDRREVRLRRDQLPADLRRAAERRAAGAFRKSLRRHTMLHEDMRSFYNGFPRDAHPMAILSSVVGALSTFYQDSLNPRDPQAGRGLGPPADGQAADDRGLCLQEVDRPAVHLSAEQPVTTARTSCR